MSKYFDAAQLSFISLSADELLERKRAYSQLARRTALHFVAYWLRNRAVGGLFLTGYLILASAGIRDWVGGRRSYVSIAVAIAVALFASWLVMDNPRVQQIWERWADEENEAREEWLMHRDTLSAIREFLRAKRTSD